MRIPAIEAGLDYRQIVDRNQIFTAQVANNAEIACSKCLLVS